MVLIAGGQPQQARLVPVFQQVDLTLFIGCHIPNAITDVPAVNLLRRIVADFDTDQRF
jgi:hypothetical protein